MPILSAKPSSRRHYLSQTELQQYADISITNSDEADDKISQAEELIDNYVGFQDSFLKNEITGRCSSAGGSNTLILKADQKNVYQNDYFKLCEIEIIGGTGEGQRRKISASVYASGQITVDENWATNPDTTSFYRIYQLGRFPRREDVKYYTDETPYQYYKTIPEAIKRAIAAQVEFFVNMGDKYFASDKVMKQSESISRYSYSKAEGKVGINSLIAPKAKMLLREVLNRVGELV